MYRYNFADQQLVEDRVARFREQMQRFLSGKLREDEFRPLRLQNGLYIQRHAPMLRVAIPYGVLSADQLDKLADIALRWDRGYGHFTTRCNLQFNWVRLEDAPDILAELATVPDQSGCLSLAYGIVADVSGRKKSGCVPSRTPRINRRLRPRNSSLCSSSC